MSLGEKLITATEKAAEIKTACDNTAEAINTKLGTTDPVVVSDFPDKVNEVYDKGKNSFMDTYLTPKEYNYFNVCSYMFAGLAWNDDTFYPTKDIVFAGTNTRIFMENHVTNIRQRLIDLNVKIKWISRGETINFYYGSHTSELPDIQDFNSSSMESFCRNCVNLTWIPQCYGVSGNRSIAYFAYGCKNLETIEKIDFSSVTSSSNAFTNCTKLANITCEGSISVNVSFSSSPLTVASMKSVITHLSNFAGTVNDGKYTISFSGTRWEALEASGKPFDDGLTDDETMTWEDYVGSLGWLI